MHRQKTKNEIYHPNFRHFPIVFWHKCSSARIIRHTTVVSSNRLQDKYKETGKTVVVLTSKDIEQYAVNSIEDLLQDVAGVNLNSRGGFGVQSDIGLRGSTFSQVLVLIDNQRLNDGLTGHFQQQYSYRFI